MSTTPHAGRNYREHVGRCERIEEENFAVRKFSLLCSDLFFPDSEISFNAFTSDHILAVDSSGVGGSRL